VTAAVSSLQAVAGDGRQVRANPVVPGRRNPADILFRRFSGHTCLSDRRCRMSRLRFAVRVMRPLPFPDFSYSFFAVYRRSG
jgi:hypothetical protein